MKMLSVIFDDNEMPEEVLFYMTTQEAALLYAFVGHISPRSILDATNGDSRWSDALFEAAEGLGNFFNLFWEGGPSDVAPRLNPRVGVPDA